MRWIRAGIHRQKATWTVHMHPTPCFLSLHYSLLRLNSYPHWAVFFAPSHLPESLLVDFAVHQTHLEIHASIAVWFCSFFIFYLFFSCYDHEKRTLFTLKPPGLPRHAPPHVHASCANMGATPPPLHFLHLSLYSTMVFLLYPAPLHLILYCYPHTHRLPLVLQSKQ